jgi:hypothetical protein
MLIFLQNERGLIKTNDTIDGSAAQEVQWVVEATAFPYPMLKCFKPACFVLKMIYYKS